MDLFPAVELQCCISCFYKGFDFISKVTGLRNETNVTCMLTMHFILKLEISASVAKLIILHFHIRTIDKAEFQKMMEAMRSRTKQVVRAHEKIVDDSGLVEFFFGRDGKKLLKHEEFEQFLRKLHEEVCLTSESFKHSQNGFCLSST
jgi:hypothetical protein